MSNRKTAERGRRKQRARRDQWKVASVLVLCLAAALLFLPTVTAIRRALGLPPAPVSISAAQSPTPVLSKEYIYAGGRLVAVEEPSRRSPYPGGLPHPIPGSMQAEDFDDGGEGIAYHDIDPQFANGTYRPGGVYIENCANPDGGCNVGSAWGGEWLEYTVEVAAAGTYTVEARVASGNGGGGTFRLELDGSPVTSALTVPETGGWQVYQTVAASVALPSGVHVLRLSLLGNGPQGGAGNYNYFRFTTGPAGSAPSSFLATAAKNGSVALAWGPPASGGSVDHYEVERAVSLTDAAPASFSCAASPCADSGALTGKAYLYRVRAVFAAGGVSAYSNQDLAATHVFADDPLNPRGAWTTIRAQHFTELGGAVNAVRGAAGLAPFNWTDQAPQSNGVILASHYNDLRSALAEALTRLGLPGPQSPAASAGGVIARQPVQELRNVMR